MLSSTKQLSALVLKHTLSSVPPVHLCSCSRRGLGGRPNKLVCYNTSKEGSPSPPPRSEGSPEPEPETSPRTVSVVPEAQAPTSSDEGMQSGGPISHNIEINQDYFASEELINELKTEIGTRGEGWFIAQMVVVALLVFSPFKLQGLVDLVGTVCLTTGLVFIAYSLLSLGRNLSPMPRPRTQHTLVTTGMYAYLRHPMYGGLLLASLGLAALSRSETRLALALLLWWILEQKVVLEEAALLERYPTEYEAYRSRVRKFVPWLY